MVGEGRSEGDGQVGGVHVVPLEGAIVVCYGGGRGPTLEEWTWWCHWRVPL